MNTQIQYLQKRLQAAEAQVGELTLYLQAYKGALDELVSVACGFAFDEALGIPHPTTAEIDAFLREKSIAISESK